MIKLTVSDVDGTLLLKNETVLDSRILLSLQKLLDGGMKVAVASGRTYGSLCDIFKPLSDKLYFICCDGAVTVQNDKVLYTRSISTNDVISVINHPNYSNCGIILCTPKKSYILRGDEAFSEEAYRQSLEKSEFLTSFYGLCEPVVKICIFSKEGKAKPMNFMSKALRVSYLSDTWCEYVSTISNKGLAVSDLQMRLYLSKFDTLAIGDGVNDIEMMKKAKYAVSVPDSSPELEAVCNIHAEDVGAFLDGVQNLK